MILVGEFKVDINHDEKERMAMLEKENKIRKRKFFDTMLKIMIKNEDLINIFLHWKRKKKVTMQWN